MEALREKLEALNTAVVREEVGVRWSPEVAAHIARCNSNTAEAEVAAARAHLAELQRLEP